MQPILLNISIQANALQYILNILADRPYKEVAPLIADIEKQAAKQMQETRVVEENVG